MQTYNRQEFFATFLPKWQQGEHLTIVAPTGAGKTYLVADLLHRWRYIVMLATKKRDKTLSRYTGFARREKWQHDWYDERILLNPKPKSIDDNVTQRQVAYAVMAAVFEQGGWTFVIDDAYYLCEELGLADKLRMLYTNTRSNAVTIVTNLQMPTWVPKQCLSQAKYVLIFKIYGKIEIDRVAYATSVPRDALVKAIAELDAENHEFLFIEQGKPDIVLVR